jgi:uncharacterized protein YybS (DUF2232 family)
VNNVPYPAKITKVNATIPSILVAQRRERPAIEWMALDSVLMTLIREDHALLFLGKSH